MAQLPRFGRLAMPHMLALWLTFAMNVSPIHLERNLQGWQGFPNTTLQLRHIFHPWQGKKHLGFFLAIKPPMGKCYGTFLKDFFGSSDFLWASLYVIKIQKLYTCIYMYVYIYIYIIYIYTRIYQMIYRE